MTITRPHPAGEAADRDVPSECLDIQYTLNGRPVRARVEARRLLVHHLREDQAD